MPDLTPSVDPRELGVDPSRLRRVDDVLRGYVDAGLLPCAQYLLTRRGEVVHHHASGWADVEARRPLARDAIFRIYSMTKPATSVLLLMLQEQGLVHLDDPVEIHLPELADPRVWVSGSTEEDLVTRPAGRSITILDLLTHTSGLTYGFQNAHPVDALYRKRELGQLGVIPDIDNAEMVKVLGDLPLQFEPGTSWWYSMGHEVIGAVIEVVTGRPLDEVFADFLLGPLGMVDTAFWVDGDDRGDRLTTLYEFEPGGVRRIEHQDAFPAFDRPVMLNGGGGLVSTMADWHRFTQFLLRGGELDGVRLLSPRSIEMMARNHLPGGIYTALGRRGYSEVGSEFVGFGLGVSVNIDPIANKALGSAGDYGWGGAASTVFIVDPVEELTMTFLTQLMPNSYPLRRQLRATTYQALVD